jgi:hypothetical protein
MEQIFIAALIGFGFVVFCCRCGLQQHAIKEQLQKKIVSILIPLLKLLAELMWPFVLLGTRLPPNTSS